MKKIENINIKRKRKRKMLKKIETIKRINRKKEVEQ